MEKDPLIKWISIIYRRSLIYANECLKDFNITGGQLPFFIRIADTEGITQEELSGYLRINKSTTAKAVRALELNGYVTKTISVSDKRSYNLYPTKKAIELRKKIRDFALVWEDILLSGIDETDKKQIRKSIEKMAENADEFINRSEKNGPKI